MRHSFTLPLYASLIRDQHGTADTALVPAGYSPDGTGAGLRPFAVAIPVANIFATERGRGVAQTAENAETA